MNITQWIAITTLLTGIFFLVAYSIDVVKRYREGHLHIPGVFFILASITFTIYGSLVTYKAFHPKYKLPLGLPASMTD